jgi:hypothetical protein
MNSSRRTFSTRFVTSVALGIGFLAAAAPAARASNVYAYSQQTLDKLAFTGATLSPLTTSTSDSATLTGYAGVANSDPTDALVAFVGTANAGSAQNYFPAAGALGTASFARGDVLLGGGAFSTVAEGSVVGAGLATGDSSYTVSGDFTLTGAGLHQVALAFEYANALRVDFSGAEPGLSAANFKTNFTIKITDINGTVVFDSSPSELNKSISLTAAGTTSFSNASTPFSVSTDLLAGTYTASITSLSEIALRSSVPEPSSVILMGCGIASAVGFAARRARQTASNA